MISSNCRNRPSGGLVQVIKYHMNQTPLTLRYCKLYGSTDIHPKGLRSNDIMSNYHTQRQKKPQNVTNWDMIPQSDSITDNPSKLHNVTDNPMKSHNVKHIQDVTNCNTVTSSIMNSITNSHSVAKHYMFSQTATSHSYTMLLRHNFTNSQGHKQPHNATQLHNVRNRDTWHKHSLS